MSIKVARFVTSCFFVKKKIKKKFKRGLKSCWIYWHCLHAAATCNITTNHWWQMLIMWLTLRAPKLGTERRGTFWYLVLWKHFSRCHSRPEVWCPAWKLLDGGLQKPVTVKKNSEPSLNNCWNLKNWFYVLRKLWLIICSEHVKNSLKNVCLEKNEWIFAVILCVMCVYCVYFSCIFVEFLRLLV